MNAIERSFEQQLDSLKIITLTDGEVWSARDLMPFAGYKAWQDWSRAINRAIDSVNTSGLDASEHFRGAPKMVALGSGARREVEDVELTRYACYILFQNADARKPEVAAAQQYFAVKTRQAEVAQPALSDDEIVHRALQITAAKVHELEAKIEADAPKVAYIDEFVRRDDVRLFRNVAKSLGMTESALREDLLKRGWIYRETITRWSPSQGEEIEVHRYSAYADKAPYFKPIPNHDAPKFKGEVMHTLKITPAGASALARLYSKGAAS